MNDDRPPIAPDLDVLAIVLPSWVGDTVMATPCLRALRDLLPNTRLIGVMRPGLDEVLAGTPWLDDMHASHHRGTFGPLRAAGELRSVGADAVLLMPNSFRTALTARLARVRRRVGYDRDGRRRLLTHPIPVPKTDGPASTVRYYLDLIEAATGLSDLDPRLELGVTSEECIEADRVLQDVPARFIALNPGGNKEAKRWPADRFARVAESLHSTHDMGIVVTGSPAESSILESIVADAKVPITNLSGRGMTLGSLKAVLKRASLLITNDTGPRHIAAAVGTPTVCLFGPTDHRWTTLEGVQERHVLADPFLPEELIADAHPERCSIERIEIADVIAAARALLDTLP